MAFDSLKSQVKDYKAKRVELKDERALFDIEQAKVDSLSNISTNFDDEILNAFGQIQDEFSLEKDSLDQRADELSKDRDGILDNINAEQVKIDTVQKKADGLTGKRYTKPLDKVIQKCEALMSELDEMLAEIGSDGNTVSGGNTLSDTVAVPDRGASDYVDSYAQDGGLYVKRDPGIPAVPSGPKFGNFDLAPTGNGSDFFVQGMNYNGFIEDYNHSEKSTFESFGRNEIVTKISPGLIEGIHLGPQEAADSTIFWSQHESGGTKDSFVEIASHIPEVNRLLESGLTLDQIREIPELERCADIYFEPSNFPRVIQSRGYYEFEDNGRHRILAAREAGYDISVKIVGRRTWQ